MFPLFFFFLQKSQNKIGVYLSGNFEKERIREDRLISDALLDDYSWWGKEDAHNRKLKLTVCFSGKLTLQKCVTDVVSAARSLRTIPVTRPT